MTGLLDVHVERQFTEHEHRDLAVGLAQLQETTEESDLLSGAGLWSRLRRTLSWLHDELEPHAAWEDGWLYPQIDAIAGTPWATRTMRYEHRQIGALVSILESDSERMAIRTTRRLMSEVVRHLSSMSAVLHAHIEREERLLLPMLDTGPAHPA